ncbi:MULTISPECIES: glycosyltransferase [unclassified Roseofilum]|uniref:glycosyltransferase n=1 Tax=unclassified Roseofilum TaxID=2620099 RepID=UPI000E9C4BC4|nr:MULTISPECIES: glycosyltransferase [unclassified Roseofilum]MBP0008134.1 glycosyltransferase [Roseofilum sp. Belize Diploria]MBP0032629.1 glycosyltransferase [Roseofilum sp. Belize BBD 4]HBR00924.1 glycosyl transferase group 1 family protein [Cyanobacteria bacterium UBA11691]
MAHSTKMKLIIPIEYYRSGGVERVIISLIEEFSKKIEKVIIVLPKKDIHYFQKILPSSEIIVYESFVPPKNILLSFLRILISGSKIFKIKQLEKKIKKVRNKQSKHNALNGLIEKYQATHCLYVLTNRLTPPNLKIPLGMIAHDVFWRFAPMTYPEDYVREYDQSLLAWLKKSDLVFTVSEKTKTDIISTFPGFSSKIKPIPNAGVAIRKMESDRETTVNSSDRITFYFPSSFGIYKDHLTLLRSGIKVAQKKLQFQVVLTGKETDALVNGRLSLSQQSSTQEYSNYLNQCHQVYSDNRDLIEQYFNGLGYGEYEQVEYWYQHCSCVIIPSQYEGFGLALSEAISRGLPVIASDLEVFQEQVKLYQCFDQVEFFPRGDAEALAACIEKFVHHPKSKLNREKIQEKLSLWTWTDAAQQYISLLESVV